MRTVTTLPVTEKTVAQQYDDTTKLGNWDASRSPIDRVIIHTMDGFAEGADERFNDATTNVSAHYGIRETGEIWHWVDEDKTAYHAGDYAMNQRSIGIEHEDNAQPNGVRPDALYNASGKLVADICKFYNIPVDRAHILKHSEVSDNPTACPDSLDIDRIVSLAQNGGIDPNVQCPIDRDANWNMPQKAIQLLSITVPTNPTLEDKQKIGEQMAEAIQELIDYKNNHRDVAPAEPVVQPVENVSTPTVEVPSLPKETNTLPDQPNPSIFQPPQTVSLSIGQLIDNLIFCVLNRNEAKQ